MIANHLKIALKHFKRHKLFTLINIIGLSIGISASLIIFLIVNHDFSFDRFHPDRERIYRVVTNYDFSGEKVYNMGVSAPLPEAIRQEVTGVEKTAPFITLYSMDVNVHSGGIRKTFKQQQQIILAESSYFDIFRYEWLAGSVKEALTQPNAIVLTSDKAMLYFPGLSPADIMGRTLIYDDSINLQVTGIVTPFRENTDLKFSDFISLSTLTTTKKISDNLGLELTNWSGTSSASQCYVKLSAGTDPAAVERAITTTALKHNPPAPGDAGNTRKFGLQPLHDVHFNALYGNYQGSHIANRKTLYGLLAIAAFLLILGCINFINLNTAQSSQRAKEIGIRKAIGSTRGQLIGQLLTETFLITLTAVVISVSLTHSLLKIFSDFITSEIRFNPFQQPEILLFLVSLTLVVSLLAGFYPSMVLSAFKPVTILKNHTKNGYTRNMWLRKSLTVSQFVIAQFFIIATMMVSKQTRYALNKDLGFRKDAIVFMNTPWKNNTESRKQAFTDNLRQIPQISMISRGGVPPSSYQTSSTDAEFYDGKQNIKLQLYLKFADSDYINLYGIKLLAGRNIRKADSSAAFVINETYSRLIGFKNPADALGKYIEKFNGDKRMQVIGVVADFRQESLHNAVKPMAIMISNEAWNSSVLHIALKPQTQGDEEWKAAIAAISKAWKKIYPDDEFNYNFYDESIARFYDSEQRSSRLLAWASGLSIFISCLGLLGLAIYTTSLRTKEVGVRKVLGATVMQIMALLSKEMISLVMLSFIIVTPVAWWAMNSWIQNFADRTSISWWIFVLSGVGMLFTALLTLSSQTIRIAFTNPVKSLRSE